MLDRNAKPGIFIVYTSEQDPAASAEGDGPMTLGERRASLRRVLGADLEMTEPRWLTRTVGNSRQADRYRAGRLLLAGDAAHIFGAGGSLNVGLLDAVNLGWDLAAEGPDRAPGGLLDSYHAERHPAGRPTLLPTPAQKAVSADRRGGGGREETAALRELFGRAAPLPRAAASRRQDHPGVRRPLPDARRRRAAASAARAARAGSPPGNGRRRHPRGRAGAGGPGVLLDFTAGSAVAEAASPWPDRTRAG